MKSVSSLLYLVACLNNVQAQEQQEGQESISLNLSDVAENVERHLWHQSRMLTELLNSVFPDSADAWNYLAKYGCYCHQADLKMPGVRNNYHGPPLDELDGLCRDSFRAQRCLQNEFDKEFVKATGDNSRGYPWYIDDNTNEIVCNHKDFPKWKLREQNQFRLKNCLIEKEFVEKVVILLQNGYTQNPDWAQLTNRKYNDACPVVRSGTIPVERDECCGLGMSRKPYNAALKQCCNEQIVEVGSC